MKTLAVDFGGRRIKLGLVEDGVVIELVVMPAEAATPLATRLGPVAAALKQLCARHELRPQQCDGIGFSYPSIVDVAQARIVDHFGKFGEAHTLDLRMWAEEIFGLPLTIDNDARMALIGEWRYGHWENCDNMVLLNLGTGLGVATIIEGGILRGAHGQAGILGGHITTNLAGRKCVCGNIGCAEAEASTSVLEQLARAHPDFSTSALAGEAVLDYAALFRLAAAGDACARFLADHSLQVWSSLAVSLIHAFDPELFLLGGGVMGSGQFILPAIREYVNRHAHTPWGRVRVEAAKLGDQAALLACEWLVQEHLARAN